MVTLWYVSCCAAVFATAIVLWVFGRYTLALNWLIWYCIWFLYNEIRTVWYKYNDNVQYNDDVVQSHRSLYNSSLSSYIPLYGTPSPFLLSQVPLTQVWGAVCMTECVFVWAGAFGAMSDPRDIDEDAILKGLSAEELDQLDGDLQELDPEVWGSTRYVSVSWGRHH